MVYEIEQYEPQQEQRETECNFFNSLDDDTATWTQIAEATMPLKHSKMAYANRNYTQLPGTNHNGTARQFEISPELSAKEISRKLILINVISLIINLALALVAFYFAFVNNSSATSAFAADCVLDFISSAIVLWRYCGDNLTSVYRHAREQIACIYLGALFEISALAIIVKASSDMISNEQVVAGKDAMLEAAVGYDLVYLAVAATIACSVLTVFKCALYKTIRDNSILLDVINTLISTIFAVSIIMSQALINVNPNFWYLDPVISIVLALFMAAFGLKVIHQNFNVLRPIYRSTPSNSALLRSHSSSHLGATNVKTNSMFHLQPQKQFGSNLNASIEHQRQAAQGNWQKADYSSIAFV